jgi:hypothetical protein
LSRKNISSSVFRGASAVSASPKLQRSSFSFAKSKNNINVESLGSQENIANTLSETNRILVEIQKQLSLDFATRIAEEKAVVKKIKATESKKRFSAKEAAVESAKKIGSTLNNTFDKVIAPAKSIFSKIVEFFQLILTGIALNVAFKWLQDPSNRAKLDSVFQFIGDHWKEILAVFIGVKVLGVLYKLYRAAKLIKSIADAIRGKKPPTGPPPPSGTPGAGILPNKPLSRMNESYGRFIEGKSNIGDRARLLRRGMIGPRQLFTKGGFEALKGTIKSPLKINPATGVSGLRTFGASFILDQLIQMGFGAVRAKQIADMIERYKKLPKNKQLEARNKLEQKLAKELNYQKSSMFALDKIFSLGGETESEKKSKFGEEVLKGIGGMSAGGSVPGRGSGMIDSVKAMLAPGEEVIRTASANLFRPVLKDINENAGRLWVLFSQAVTKLISVTDYQKEVSKQFKKTIEIFDKYLKDEILKKKKSKKPPGGGGGGRSMSMNARSDQKSVSATPKVYNYNLISQGNSSGGMTFLPMNLPPIKSKPPEIPMPSNPATEVPVISSVNMANPYMQLTPEIYGIFV